MAACMAACTDSWGGLGRGNSSCVLSDRQTRASSSSDEALSLAGSSRGGFCLWKESVYICMNLAYRGGSMRFRYHAIYKSPNPSIASTPHPFLDCQSCRPPRFELEGLSYLVEKKVLPIIEPPPIHHQGLFSRHWSFLALFVSSGYMYILFAVCFRVASGYGINFQGNTSSKMLMMEDEAWLWMSASLSLMSIGIPMGFIHYH